MRWYSNAAIQYEIGRMMENREAIWVVFPKSQDKPFFVRKGMVRGTNHVDYWLNTLHAEHNSVGAFIGTNVINWDALDEIPPPYRTKLRKAFEKTTWKEYLTPKGCEARGLKWEEIWLGKSMLFDFDNPTKPMNAFKKADAVATYLLSEYNVSGTIVFSGSKGFHVHVNPEDASMITEVVFADFVDLKDPLKKIGQIYADKVVEISTAAGASYASEDRSSNFRQGIVRCPYTIHPKTGQIVWPLDEKNVESVRALPKDAEIMDIARAMHSWDIPCQSDVPDDDRLTYISPEYKVSNRGMPNFSIIECFK